MIIGHIEDATRVLGAPLGQENTVAPLAVRDVIYPDGQRAVMSAWIPTPEELIKLNAGEPVYLVVMGRSMPPCYIGVK